MSSKTYITETKEGRVESFFAMSQGRLTVTLVFSSPLEMQSEHNVLWGKKKSEAEDVWANYRIKRKCFYFTFSFGSVILKDSST